MQLPVSSLPQIDTLSLIYSNDNRPTQSSRLANRTGKASSPPARNESVPAPLCADGSDENLHVTTKLASSRLRVHLLFRQTTLAVLVGRSRG